MSERPDSAVVVRRLSQAAFLHSPALVRVLDMLEDGGGAARIVGGAVRNALLGEAITDIDIATPLLPQDVMTRASAMGLSVHPTGLAHGTVTVVADAHPFEVTTLRRDVETDGRRAVVAFSSDWREDAARRDFTINALYTDRHGNVYDYFGGLSDLGARRVRFIGDPVARIREDYLRILRFFRFNARYAKGPPDGEGLAACIAEKDGTRRLSAERVGAEMMKLLAAPRAPQTIGIMAQTSILGEVLGARACAETLERLADIETHLDLRPDPIARLAALASGGGISARDVAAKLRLSNGEADALDAAMQADAAFDPATDERDAKALLYRQGVEAYRRAGLVAWAATDVSPTDAARGQRLALPERFSAPQLPVRGADVLALGVPPGTKVGQILAAFETWWISAQFPCDPAVQQEKLRALVRQELRNR